MYIMVSGGRQECCRRCTELCEARVGLLKSVCGALINWCVFYFYVTQSQARIDNILLLLSLMTWKQALFGPGQGAKGQDEPKGVRGRRTHPRLLQCNV